MITQKNPHPDGSEVVAQTCSVKKVFLEILQKFTGKHLENSFFSGEWLYRADFHKSFGKIKGN